MEAYNIIISNEAQRQLVNYALFIAKENPEAVQRLRERFVSSARSLEQMLARYPFFNGSYIPANKYHKMLVEN